ncbi:keratin-associated protein 5-5-like [Dreissena polymorpha]|uniref:Uncharacterized protein n=1 Tax=Dreissena polymorpha TaxID=45954 RepID=A0A9D3Y2G3_DREPO|nr:keratin-associated protein 5-5-like [Dreissena polymorpha]KAH3691402.1 hypothetical protein DPMN_194036 [Dreissena polymorpha]
MVASRSKQRATDDYSVGEYQCESMMSCSECDGHCLPGGCKMGNGGGGTGSGDGRCNGGGCISGCVGYGGDGCISISN